MSMGEKLVEKAWDAMEADMREKQSCRRDFFYAVVLAVVFCAGLAAMATAVAQRTGISDAIEGGQLAKAAGLEVKSVENWKLGG